MLKSSIAISQMESMEEGLYGFLKYVRFIRLTNQTCEVRTTAETFNPFMKGCYHIETSPANQWTSLYMITASVIKGLEVETLTPALTSAKKMSQSCLFKYIDQYFRFYDLILVLSWDYMISLGIFFDCYVILFLGKTLKVFD